MAGFGAVHRLAGERQRPILFEKESYLGGHTASFTNEYGFIFDDGPHISFTKEERIQKLFAESVDQEYQTIYAEVNNFWKGQYWIKHPAQCNLYGLPPDLVVDILKDFIHVSQETHEGIENYADWLVASYGRTFAETFPMQYGLKYHTTTADNMSTDWLGSRLYQPKLEEVLRGALAADTPDVHYVSHFRYPSYNGFVSYLNKFFHKADVRLGHELIRLDPKTRELHFSNNTTQGYDHVISSIPLPELIPLIAGVPDEIVDASQRLACTSCVLVNIGLNRNNISQAHWTYFYDHDFLSTRVSFPHMLSPHNVPPGKGSIQVEVYFSSKYRPLDRNPEDCIQPVLHDLRRCGLLLEDEKVLFAHATFVPYANVIFDLDRADALANVHGFLDEINVAYCGRYGNWGYHWTDEAFISGEQAAQKILDC